MIRLTPKAQLTELLAQTLEHYTATPLNRVIVPAPLSPMQRETVERVLGLGPGWAHIGLYEAKTEKALRQLVYELRSFAVPHALAAQLVWEPPVVAPCSTVHGGDHVG